MFFLYSEIPGFKPYKTEGKTIIMLSVSQIQMTERWSWISN